MLKASPRTSRFIDSVNLKRREMRKSTLAVFGKRNELRAKIGKRLSPPAPKMPVLAAVERAEPPQIAALVQAGALPLTNAEFGRPEEIWMIGAMVKPLKIARPTLLSEVSE